MLAGWLPGHSKDLSTLFVPFRSTVGVVYRSGARGFHHTIDACVIYSSAPFLEGRRSRRPSLFHWVPAGLLVGGRVRSWLTLGYLDRFSSCTADHSSYLDHWCSPTGLDRIKRLFTWDTSCGLVVGLWDNLAAFVSVQWLPQGFSWISDSKVEPTSLTNRAIIGGIVFSGQNKEHPTTPIPVPLWLWGTLSSGPRTPCIV